MTLAANVARVLRTTPAHRINFKVDNITVDKKQMELVAKAIDAEDVQVVVGHTGPKLGAGYSSFKGRRLDPGERKIIGKITLGSEDTVKFPVGRAAVFHESVHALVDVKGFKITMHNDEVVAYLADMMYLRLAGAKVGGGTSEMEIFSAAAAIIDAHQMLTKPGVVLAWSDCDALRDAIKAHPDYRG